MEAPVLFDLDGTLVDSRADLAAAVNRVRHELDLPPFSLAEVVARVGEGARNLLRRSLPARIEGEAFEAAFSRFAVTYREHCLDLTLPYPGLVELLARLAAERPLAVLTNKPEATSRKILEGLGLAPYFQAVVGGDTLATRKPDPAGARHLAQELSAPVESLTLVGDSRIDARTAAAAPCRFVFASWGFASAAERAELAAAAWARDAAELAALLAQPAS